LPRPRSFGCGTSNSARSVWGLRESRLDTIEHTLEVLGDEVTKLSEKVAQITADIGKLDAKLDTEVASLKHSFDRLNRRLLYCVFAAFSIYIKAWDWVSYVSCVAMADAVGWLGFLSRWLVWMETRWQSVLAPSCRAVDLNASVVLRR
jgi:hypothetical protein